MRRSVPILNEPGRHNKRAFRENYRPAMSFEEIAAALGTSRQTVFTIYARALDKIRWELKRRGENYSAMLEQ